MGTADEAAGSSRQDCRSQNARFANNACMYKHTWLLSHADAATPRGAWDGHPVPAAGDHADEWGCTAPASGGGRLDPGSRKRLGPCGWPEGFSRVLGPVSPFPRVLKFGCFATKRETPRPELTLSDATTRCHAACGARWGSGWASPAPNSDAVETSRACGRRTHAKLQDNKPAPACATRCLVYHRAVTPAWLWTACGYLVINLAWNLHCRD
jgi:hypothetical protein